MRNTAEAIGWLFIACVGILGSIALLGLIASSLLHAILRHYGMVGRFIQFCWKKRGEK